MPASVSKPETARGGYFSRRNFVLGVINGALWIAGMALIDPGTVLPTYALDISGSVLGVGLISVAISIGWSWPPLLLIGPMERRRRWMTYYRAAAAVRILLAWSLVPVAFAARHGDMRSLWLMGALLVAFTSAGGAGSIPFMSTVGETIPAKWRGRFFGLRYFIGGMLSLGAGLFVKRMLSPAGRALFPANYGYLFLAAAATMSLSLLLFCFAEERPHNVVSRKLPALAHLRTGGRLFVRDPDYRHLFIARVLLGFAAGIALPFMAPFALQRLHLDPATIGVFMAASVLSYSVSDVVWSLLSDGPGNRIVLLISGACYLVVPGMVLLAPHFGTQPTGSWLGMDTSPAFWWMLLTFLLLGTSRAGQDLGQANYLLEISPSRQYPAYFAFYALVGVPLAMLPMLGAVLIGAQGHYEIGFLVSLVLVGVMVWVLRGLREIRGIEGAGAV